MKRSGLLVWSVMLVLAAVAAASGGVLAARAQDDYLAYLPLVAYEPAGPAIDYFRADVALADPGQTIELAWASSGAVTAGIWRVERGGPIAQMWDVAPTGTLTYTIATWEREYVTFSLWVADAAGLSSGAGLTIPLTCPDTWFFQPAPDGCPGTPALFAPAAEQSFEHGYMVWMDEVWAGGEPGIYVLYDDDIFSPRWDFFADTYVEDEPLCDPGEPPDDLLQPVRGFGKVWCEQPGYAPSVRERLGWATAPEQPFAGALQRNSAPKYTTLYLRSVDGNVWQLLPERSAWHKITVDYSVASCEKPQPVAQLSTPTLPPPVGAGLSAFNE